MTDETKEPGETAAGRDRDGGEAGSKPGHKNPADLPPAAQRALAEAEQRRKAAASRPAPPREIGGRGGQDPARYGDWEIKGRAIDF